MEIFINVGPISLDFSQKGIYSFNIPYELNPGWIETGIIGSELMNNPQEPINMLSPQDVLCISMALDKSGTGNSNILCLSGLSTGRFAFINPFLKNTDFEFSVIY